MSLLCFELPPTMRIVRYTYKREARSCRKRIFAFDPGILCFPVTTMSLAHCVKQTSLAVWPQLYYQDAFIAIQKTTERTFPGQQKQMMSNSTVFFLYLARSFRQYLMGEFECCWRKDNHIHPHLHPNPHPPSIQLKLGVGEWALHVLENMKNRHIHIHPKRQRACGMVCFGKYGKYYGEKHRSRFTRDVISSHRLLFFFDKMLTHGNGEKEYKMTAEFQ